MTIQSLKYYPFSYLNLWLFLLLLVVMSRSVDVRAIPDGVLPQYLAVSVNHQQL